MVKRSRLSRKKRSRSEIMRLLKQKINELDKVVEKIDLFEFGKPDPETEDRLNDEAFELEQEIMRLRVQLER